MFDKSTLAPRHCGRQNQQKLATQLDSLAAK
jgi:hypothetical protein